MKKTKGMGILANAQYVAGRPLTGFESADENAKALSGLVADTETANADFMAFLEKHVADAKEWLILQGWEDGRTKRNKDGSYRWISDLPPRAEDRSANETYAFIQEAQQVICFAHRHPKEIPAIRATFEAGRAWGAIFAYHTAGKKELGNSGLYLDELARDFERRKSAGEVRPPRRSWKSIVDRFRTRDGLGKMTLDSFRTALKEARKRKGNGILVERELRVGSR